MTTTDLFCQIYYRDPSGCYALITYYDSFPNLNVYNERGEWIGCTNVHTEAGRLANVKLIIKDHLIYRGIIKPKHKEL